MITDAETAFDEVTVDSPSFKSTNELGAGWTTLRQGCQARASINIRCVAMTLRLRPAAELPLPRVAASIESP